MGTTVVVRRLALAVALAAPMPGTPGQEPEAPASWNDEVLLDFDPRIPAGHLELELVSESDPSRTIAARRGRFPGRPLVTYWHGREPHQLRDVPAGSYRVRVVSDAPGHPWRDIGARRYPQDLRRASEHFGEHDLPYVVPTRFGGWHHATVEAWDARTLDRAHVRMVDLDGGEPGAWHPVPARDGNPHSAGCPAGATLEVCLLLPADRAVRLDFAVDDSGIASVLVEAGDATSYVRLAPAPRARVVVDVDPQARANQCALVPLAWCGEPSDLPWVVSGWTKFASGVPFDVPLVGEPPYAVVYFGVLHRPERWWWPLPPEWDGRAAEPLRLPPPEVASRDR